MKVAPTMRRVAAAMTVIALAAGTTSALGAPAQRAGGAEGQSLKASVGAGKGYFVGTLRARTLAWSLAFDRRSSAAVTARLAIGTGAAGGSVAKTLCSVCANPARGTTALSAKLANALRAGYARLEVRGAGVAAGLQGRVVTGAAPVLEILSPKPGETISLPSEVRYRVDGLEVAQGVALAVYAVGGEIRRVQIPLSEASGTVMLPDAKDAFLVGSHDLAFQLVTPSGVRLPNSEATVVVRDVHVQGRRGA